jgi:hypothetical protein
MVIHIPIGMDDEEEPVRRRTNHHGLLREQNAGATTADVCGKRRASTTDYATRCSTRCCSPRRAQARAVLAAWKDDYNNVPPHSALGDPRPSEYRYQCMPDHSGEALRHSGAPPPDPLFHRTHYWRTDIAPKFYSILSFARLGGGSDGSWRVADMSRIRSLSRSPRVHSRRASRSLQEE